MAMTMLPTLFVVVYVNVCFDLLVMFALMFNRFCFASSVLILSHLLCWLVLGWLLNQPRWDYLRQIKRINTGVRGLKIENPPEKPLEKRFFLG